MNSFSTADACLIAGIMSSELWHTPALTKGLSKVSRSSSQAKWDEKAEQWIVNDLGKEGSNVNGWHWQEKNKLPWSKQRIDQLVKGLSTQLDASVGSAEIKGVKDLTGEVQPMCMSCSISDHSRLVLQGTLWQTGELTLC